MNRSIALTCALLGGLSAICSAVQSTESNPPESPGQEIGFAVTADVFGKYIWRGQDLVDDPVVQPGASVTLGELTASAWGNLETSDINDEEGEFAEFDWTLEYANDMPHLDGASYAIGVIHYHFPSAGNTTELYAGLAIDCLLNPSVTLYRDVDEADGTYVALGVAHGVLVLPSEDNPVNLEVGATLGWGDSSYNGAYWGATASTSELNDLVLTIALPLELMGWSVTPNATYVTLLGGDVRSSNAFGTDDDHLFGGVGFAREF